MSEPYAAPPAPPGPPGPPNPPSGPPPGPGTASGSASGGGASGGGSSLGLKLGIGALGVALVAGIGVGGWALYENVLGGGGPQPHDVLPEDTLAYARLDLDPSASQKVALLRLVNRFPEVGDALDVKSDDDLREIAFTRWLGLEEACDVDYDKDVKPWLGERAGLALTGGIEVTSDEDETERSVAEHTVMVVQVTDEDAAREGIAQLADGCGVISDIADDLEYDEADVPGITFRDGYALISVNQEASDAIDAAAGEGTLGDNDAFSADFDELGEDGLVSGWYDQAAVTKLTDEAIKQLEEDGEEIPDDVTEFLDAYESVESVAMTLRADESSVELAGLSRFTENPETPDVAGLDALPTDTLAGLSIIGAGDLFDEAWSSLEPFLSDMYELSGDLECFDVPDVEPIEPAVPELPDVQLQPDPDAPAPDGPAPEPSPEPTPEEEDEPTPEEICESPSFEQFLGEIEEDTGVSIPDDISTLLGDGVTIYLGSEGLDEVDPDRGPEGVEDIPVGIVFTTDGEIMDVLEKVTEVLSGEGVDLAVKETDDGAVLATTEDLAEKLATSGDLGSDENFTAVMSSDDGSLGGLYVDLGGIIDVLESWDPPKEIAEQLDDLAFLQSFGISSWESSDTGVSFSMKLSFTEE